MLGTERNGTERTAQPTMVATMPLQSSDIAPCHATPTRAEPSRDSNPQQLLIYRFGCDRSEGAKYCAESVVGCSKVPRLESSHTVVATDSFIRVEFCFCLAKGETEGTRERVANKTSDPSSRFVSFRFVSFRVFEFFLREGVG